MPNYGYHLARAKGRATRAFYRALLPAIIRSKIEPPGSFPLEVFAYSGEVALPEQVASIRSFLRWVGRPPRFTVVSDGTYSDRSIELLRRLDPAVTVSAASEWVPPNLPDKIYPYLKTHPTGRQLALIMSLPKNAPVLYLDSDILFFAGAKDLLEHAETRDLPALYLPDCRFSGDERLLHTPSEQTDPVNTGFLLLFRPLDWSLSVARFLELQGAPNFFTNQTMAHLAMHANGAGEFDSRKYVLQLDDQFTYPDRYANSRIAMRHYVNPVRHKFWTSLPASGSIA
ncbi:MAG: hypothetical protein DLM73_09430 [Chthoniobacterales bacterium]|nr:MAG: hypothetical protein DLM73_09430 [Chthoniobacterales bacterium]